MKAQDFIAIIAPMAVAEQRRKGVLASIIIAQGAIESGWSSAAPGNLFGIKGSGQLQETKEFINDHWINTVAGFRVYDSWEDSVQDHSQFLIENGRYAKAGYFNCCKELDYVGAARCLQNAGYATDPNYAAKLVQIIQANGLVKLGTWSQAKAAGIDEQTISKQRGVRNVYYQEYLRTEAIEIEGVVETLAELSKYVRMAIVTTAKRADFQLIHEKRQIRQFMEFVLAREDYERTKPHPEPYLTGLKRFGATKEETLVVEDSNRGLNSAVAADIDCAIVHNDFTKTHDF